MTPENISWFLGLLQSHPYLVMAAIVALLGYSYRDQLPAIVAKIRQSLPETTAPEKQGCDRERAFGLYCELRDVLERHKAKPEHIAALQSILPVIGELEGQHEKDQ